ncbi:histidine kinase [Pseudonocardia saturnea]
MADALVVDPLSGGSARLVRRFSAPERHLAFWVALWIAVVAGGLGSLAQFVLERSVPVDPVQVVFRLVGASFAACGLIAWHRRPDSHSGRLLAATGFALYVSPLLSLIDSSVARTAAHLFPDLWVLPFVALVLTFLTGGRLRTPVDRVLVGAALFELVVLAPLYLLFADLEGSIRFLPAPGPAAVVDFVQRALFLLICVATAAVVLARWRTASPPGRRAMAPAVAGAACLLAFGALLAVGIAGGGRMPVLLWVAACMLVTVPIVFLAGLLRSRLARGGVADLFRGLRTMRPDELQAALARALGDPALVVAYPRPDGSYIDAASLPVTLPEPGGDRSVAIVERDAEPVAALVYDRSLDDDPELVDAVGAAATIALENRQLHAEAEARRTELEASRERIITAADAERRRIERNLHDGAQQRLVTLALQLSLIGRQIRQDPTGAEELVTLATGELAQSLEELRELARGIHPAVLDQGLGPALEALALPSAVPTVVTCDPGPRLPQGVEFAAYFVASEALANVAKYARATAATVRVTRSEGAVVVEIADDGIGGADPGTGTGLRGLADRIEALHGRLRVSSPAGGGTVVTAEIPLRVASPHGPGPHDDAHPGR